MSGAPQQFSSLNYKQNQEKIQRNELVKEKLKELGPGPYTAEQQKLKDSYISYLSKESVQYSIPSHVNLNQNPSMATSSNSQTTTETNNTTTGQQSSFANQNQILDKRALQDLVKEVDPSEQLDEDVEDLLLQVADDFIENIINSSCQLAKHRKSNVLEVKDVQFHLERNFNIWIPGFASTELKPFKKSYATEAHKQRLQLIKKSTKPNENKDKAKD